MLMICLGYSGSGRTPVGSIPVPFQFPGIDAPAVDIYGRLQGTKLEHRLKQCYMWITAGMQRPGLIGVARQRIGSSVSEM
jgi:hypothetical protein